MDPHVAAEKVDTRFVNQLLENAFLDSRIDGDGDVMVSIAGVHLYVRVQPERQQIKLMTRFSFRPGAARVAKFELANRLNAEYVIARAIVSNDEEHLFFDYDLVYLGGFVPKAFIKVVQLFPEIMREGLTKRDVANIVA